jgi:fumarate reductase flavoprotein subunit
VVGGGGSGLAAAIRSAQLGLTVLVIEKAGRPGGTTGMSVGSMSASRTSAQERAGVVDSAEAHFHDMGLFHPSFAGSDNLPLRRLYAEHSGEALEWLVELGLTFSGPWPEAPHSVPRLHNVVPDSGAYPARLVSVARTLGVSFRMNSTVLELRFRDKRVTGVVVEREGSHATVDAAKGVILAAGDFSSDRALTARWAGRHLLSSRPVNLDCTGDGIRLGVRAGGKVVETDGVTRSRLTLPEPPSTWIRRCARTSAGRLLLKTVMRAPSRPLARSLALMTSTCLLQPNPEILAFGAVLIDRNGDRVGSDADGLRRGVPASEDGGLFLLLDARIASRLSGWPGFFSTAPGVGYAYLDDFVRSRRDVVQRTKTIAELAESLSIERTRLEHVLASSGGGEDREWTPPFYSIGPLESRLITTNSGLAVDSRLRVLRAGRTPVAGLYAVGANGQGGLVLGGHGAHVGWAFVSGKLAAESIATS